MLEIKGDISLIDALQMIKPLQGEFIVYTEGEEIHVKDGAITWFSSGDEDRCLKYISRYSGNVKIETGKVKMKWKIPIDEAIMRAVLVAPPNKNTDPETVLTSIDRTRGWFALIKGERIIASKHIDRKKLKEILSFWKTVEISGKKPIELILITRNGVYDMLKTGNNFIIGFCESDKALGKLHGAVKELKKYVFKEFKR